MGAGVRWPFWSGFENDTTARFGICGIVVPRIQILAVQKGRGDREDVALVLKVGL